MVAGIFSGRVKWKGNERDFIHTRFRFFPVDFARGGLSFDFRPVCTRKEAGALSASPAAAPDIGPFPGL